MGLEFKNNVLIIGYGAVSKCTLPILLRHVNIPLENITIIDFKNKAQDLKAWTTRGLRFDRRQKSPLKLLIVSCQNIFQTAGLSSIWRGTSTAATSCSGAMTIMSCT